MLATHQLALLVTAVLLGFFVGLGCHLYIKFRLLQQRIVEVDAMEALVQEAFWSLKDRGGWYYKSHRRPTDTNLFDLYITMLFPAVIIALIVTTLLVLLATGKPESLFVLGSFSQIILGALLLAFVGLLIGYTRFQDKLSITSYPLIDRDLSKPLLVLADAFPEAEERGGPMPMLLTYKLLPQESTGKLEVRRMPAELKVLLEQAGHDASGVAAASGVTIYPVSEVEIVIKNTNPTVRMEVNQIRIEPNFATSITGGDHIILSIDDGLSIEIDIIGQQTAIGLQKDIRWRRY